MKLYQGAISVFDLDHTLVGCNSSYVFCTFLHRQKAISTMAMLKAYWFRLKHDLFSIELEQLHSELFKRLLHGLSMEYLESFIEQFMDDYILKKFYSPAFEELRMAQHSGAYTVIMSSSPSFLVKRVAELLGVDEWLATEYRLDSSNRLVGVHNFIDGKAKADALRELAAKRGVALQDISAYTDSFRDLPLLELVGHPVAVNPDSRLRALSLKNNWRSL